jgi:DNA-binding MarR family transcriptional regulator
MNLIVAQLEAEALITRAPDPGNGRILRAALTRKGHRRLTACEGAVDRIEAQILSGLDAESVDRLRDGLQACAAALQGMSGSAASR